MKPFRSLPAPSNYLILLEWNHPLHFQQFLSISLVSFWYKPSDEFSMSARTLLSNIFILSSVLVSSCANANTEPSIGIPKETRALLNITTVSDLNFGFASAGDSAKIISANTIEDAYNASFSVTGDPNATYTIVLPTTVTMITGAGGTNRTIDVSNFTSFPSGTGLLNAGGAQNLFVGAMRAALPITQVAGNYSTTFTVTVSY